MKRYSISAPRMSLFTVLVAVGLVVVLLPWKVVAQPAQQDESNDNAKTTQKASSSSTGSSEQTVVTRSLTGSNSSTVQDTDSTTRGTGRSGSSTTGQRRVQVSSGSGQGSSSASGSSVSSGGSGSNQSVSGGSGSNRAVSGGSGTAFASGGQSSAQGVASSSSSSGGESNFTFSENGKTLKIRQTEDRIEVTRETNVDGERRVQKNVFRTPEEFREKLPAEYERFRSMSRGSGDARVSAFGFDTGGEGRDSEEGLNRAQQMLLEQLNKMKDEAADNPQMVALIEQMINDLKNESDK